MCAGFGRDTSARRPGRTAKIVKVRTQQWQTSDGAKTEYEVTDVLDHRPAGLQTRLPGL
ncbi:hypothetical protein GON15_07200 [Burkholderia contaminans]|nr:hypothetical protein GON15_07200 [Burkholderia contaminans]